jgi:hypothetical protein
MDKFLLIVSLLLTFKFGDSQTEIYLQVQHSIGRVT